MDPFWIFVVIASLGLVGFGLQILAVRATVLANGPSCENPDASKAWLPVSILKPLKGLEDNLFSNLESFCLQDYPVYEIVFSLQDLNDAAYKVVQKVKEKYPHRDFSILVERCNDGLNPKINNLLPAYDRAKHPYIVISDANVIVDRNYLRRIMAPMEDPKVGLVNNLIRGVGGRTLGSLFENLHLNSFILGSTCFLDRYLNIPCVVGKSMLMRKEDLEAIGGLKAFKNVLAEDHLIGEAIRRRGQKVVVSNYLINNVNDYWGLSRFINRHIRWGKMRWKLLGGRYLVELVGNPVFVSLLPLLLWGWTSRALTLAIGVSFLKSAGDYCLGKRIGSPLSSTIYLLSPIKDLLIAAIWFLSLGSDTVTWRGKRYLIGKDTVLSPCPATGVWSFKYRVLDGIRTRLA